MRTFAVAALFAVAGSASAQLSITEVFIGLSGEDGTADWFEVTNTGASDIDTGSFFYDDSSASIFEGGQLDSFVLSAGESAIFLISDDLADSVSDEVNFTSVLDEFAAIWGPVANVGITNGGGGLSQNGDAVNVLDGTNTVVDVAEYSAMDATDAGLSTLDYTSGSPVASVLGVNGAYASNAFFNDNLGLPNNEAVLIGSPGAIPAPGAAALLGLAGLAATRRR